MKNLSSMIIGILTLCLMVSVNAHAQEVAGKEIRIESGQESSIKVEFKTTKDSYEVNEPIAFSVKSSKDAYLYLFYASKKGWQQAYPNKTEPANLLKANKTVTFPNKVKISGNQAGSEKFMLVASSKKLDLSPKEIFDSPYFDVDQDSLEGMTKSIVIESPRQPSMTAITESASGQAVKMLTVNITDKETGFLMSGDEVRPLVLVSTDKVRYNLGDSVTIGYASEEDGNLKLVLVLPSKKTETLFAGKIEKGRFYRWNGKASAPAGKHAIVALFSPSSEKAPEATDDFIEFISDAPIKSKGLIPESRAREFRTVHQFVIE